MWDISQYEEKLQNAKSVAVGMKKTVVNMNNISVLSLLENDDMSEVKRGKLRIQVIGENEWRYPGSLQ